MKFLTNQMVGLIRTIVNFLGEQPDFKCIKKVDAVFVFGCVVRGVYDTASSLMLFQKAPVLMLTGKGRRPDLLEGHQSEVDFGLDILNRTGINKRKYGNRLLWEKISTNSKENVCEGMPVLLAEHEVRRMIVCASRPHLKRAMATIAVDYPDIKLIPQGPDENIETAFGDGSQRHINRIRSLIKEVLVRIPDYGQKGDIRQVEIPAKIRGAAMELQEILNGPRV